MSERPPDEIFQTEPVDVSRKYGITMIVAAVLVFVTRFTAGPGMASSLGAAVLAGSGVTWLLPHGKRVVQWKEVLKDE